MTVNAIRGVPDGRALSYHEGKPESSLHFFRERAMNRFLPDRFTQLLIGTVLLATFFPATGSFERSLRSSSLPGRGRDSTLIVAPGGAPSDATDA